MKFPDDFKNSFKQSQNFILWILVDTYQQKMVNSTFKLLHHDEKTIIALLKNGWNSIDLTDLFNSIKFLNETNFDGLILECENEFRFELLNDTYSKKTLKNGLKTLTISVNPSEKPLIQLNSKGGKILKKSKRSTQLLKNKRSNNRFRDKISSHLFKNKRSNNIFESRTNSFNTYRKLCKNNQIDPRNKCCLMSYKVDFSALKLTEWIISPLAFSANYCFGLCYSHLLDCKYLYKCNHIFFYFKSIFMFKMMKIYFQITLNSKN
jgi:hypothetical protein